jgi:hypothetical protein
VGGGAAVGHYRRMDPGAETSSFLGAVTVTARRQYIVEWFPDAYFAGGTRVEGELRYQHYPDVFYGVGPDTPEALEEDYTSRVADVRARVQRMVRPGLRAGFEGRLRHENMVSVEEDGLLADGALPGDDGGTAVGVGVVATWDTRDNLFSPRDGRFAELSWTLHDGLLGSDFDFHRVVLDGRTFVPLGEASVLALQAYLEAAPGRAPFSFMPLLGGRSRMRGYREGRFRDRVFATIQGEFRFPVWRRFGSVAFAGVGDVASRPADLRLSSAEVAGGVGARFRLTDEGVTLRGDFAVGREGTGLYFTIGQAF